MAHSKIFLKNRALGYVSNHIPLVTRYIDRRKENLIVTCVGNAFHTYGCAHFTLLSVSGTHPGEITCLAADTYHIYTACENVIYAWRRGTELKRTYKGHECSVHTLLPFGPHLISVDEDCNVKIWDIKSEEIIVELSFSNRVFKITTLMHPNTYMNKVLFGSEQGQLQLWNIKIAKLIYTFNGWNTPVTALEQAPAVDVVAVGLSDGRIILHNLKYNESLFELVQDWGSVISISFRTDGHPIMATGSLEGHIVFWNLEEQKVESQLHKAHFGAVTGLKYLPNEPLLVSSSPDNSLKLWIFDLADGAGRLLRIREAHAEPPTGIRFYGNEGHNILTAGSDSSLRIFSTVTEILNKSLGRASFNRKASKKKGRTIADPMIMPPITTFAAETTREKEWDNIVATHSGLGTVTTWSSNQAKMGAFKLFPEKFKGNRNVFATTVCLTKCGNFVIIGYNTGHVEKFNMQSGIHRGSYGNDVGAHNGPVKGVMVGPLNQTVITAGRDGFIQFWDFKPKKGITEPKAKLVMDEPIEWLRYHSDSSLVAVALEDFSVVVIDLDTRRIVRRFEGHEGRITDACFNPDSRWLITASMDCTIRVWDVPSSNLIDIFQVPEACTSLHFSPTGEFLATTHVCNLGVYLWSNRTLYSHISLKAINKDDPIPMIGLPGSVVEVSDIAEDELVELEPEYVSPEQLQNDLITMSGFANSKWQNILNIDIVRKRNKPREALKAPENAPFFLPTIPSLELKFDFSNVKNMEANKKLITHPDIQNLTIFSKALLSVENNEFHEVVEKFKYMSPSSIDFEIQSLSADENTTQTLLLQFMKMIHYMMEKKTDFELAQAYLSVFLKWHGTEITKNESLRNYLSTLQEVQSKNWFLLRDKLFYNLSVVQALKKM
ncbi:PREDICTED: WD repeat-containing protein 36 [Dufourea novaeangliae]|uniref:WD repeat-containing protein 36 n=1 Tax=Dufourea novaeangliae TaxID=178035 RepID=A0A154NWL2_DUFNO|nr:PREDICTED: WD repeat-containing protein 36 [Dufourea novaeangliae]KZC03983.1 WD repeat-containing protein 36 [Dufourea novaeangliae]